MKFPPYLLGLLACSMLAWCGLELHGIRKHLASIPTAAEWEAAKFSYDAKKSLLARTPQVRVAGDIDVANDVRVSGEVKIDNHRPLEVEITNRTPIEVQVENHHPIEVKIMR